MNCVKRGVVNEAWDFIKDNASQAGRSVGGGQPGGFGTLTVVKKLETRQQSD